MKINAAITTTAMIISGGVNMMNSPGESLAVYEALAQEDADLACRDVTVSSS
jgi:hypothetical protein